MSRHDPKHQYCSEHPDLVALCVNCTRKSCDGKPCEEYSKLAKSMTIRECRKKAGLVEYAPLKQIRKPIDEINRHLKVMYVDYEMYKDAFENPVSSAGMVANYAPSGSGRTNKISDHTARQAIQNANIDPERLLRLRWLACVHSVFTRLITHSKMRERCKGHVLYHKALLGWTFVKISEIPLPNKSMVTSQYIRMLFNDAIKDIEVEARNRGLLK